MKKFSDELIISFLFPPSTNISGINVYKRIVENNRIVDVLQAKYDKSDEDQFKDISGLINQRLLIDIDCDEDKPFCISKFVDKAIKAIENNYSKIYSRSWFMANHFLAFEYKLRHNSTFWTAEFSDPLRFNVSNREYSPKNMTVSDKGFIKKVNNEIEILNNKTGNEFPFVEDGSTSYFICEYLVYLFADKITFTNHNQQEVMLNKFPIDIKDYVLAKSEIKHHSTLPVEYYNLKKAKLKLDNDLINIAYFGNWYYGRRHFEGLFYALESLDHKYKDKIRLHIFINDKKLLKRLVSPLSCKEYIKIRKPMPYFKFLNATTQFDVLIVNDLSTKDNFELNPYLPSKLSDYLGSSSDIWAISENGSTLSKADTKYKSDIHDYESSALELVKILNDNGFADDNYSLGEYYQTRLTSLNELYQKEFNRNVKLKQELKELKSKKRNRFFK